MKALALLTVVLSLAVASLAQNPTSSQDPPDVTVVKFSWSKERIGWERDPFGGAVESYDEMRVRTRNEKRIEDAKRGNNSAEIDRLKRDARADAAIIERQRQKAPPRYVFLYKVAVKNNSAKTIKAIDWDYIFFDPDTKNEIGRHQFTSEEKIGSDKNKELDVLFPLPPTKTISVYELNKKERTGINEQVVLMRIQYSDGSIWQRP